MWLAKIAIQQQVSNLFYIHAKTSSYVDFFYLFHLQLAAGVLYIYMLGLTFSPIACSASAHTYFVRVAQPFVTEQNLQKSLEWFVVCRLITCPSEAFWKKPTAPHLLL